MPRKIKENTCPKCLHVFMLPTKHCGPAPTKAAGKVCPACGFFIGTHLLAPSVQAEFKNLGEVICPPMTAAAVHGA